MGCFFTENSILLQSDDIACAVFLTLLIKIRRSETAVTTKQNTGYRINIQVFIKYRTQEFNYSGTGILCSITKLDFYQIPCHSIITYKWMKAIALIMEVEGSAFLYAICIRESGIRIRNNSLRYLDATADYDARASFSSTVLNTRSFVSSSEASSSK